MRAFGLESFSQSRQAQRFGSQEAPAFKHTQYFFLQFPFGQVHLTCSGSAWDSLTEPRFGSTNSGVTIREIMCLFAVFKSYVS